MFAGFCISVTWLGSLSMFCDSLGCVCFPVGSDAQNSLCSFACLWLSAVVSPSSSLVSLGVSSFLLVSLLKCQICFFKTNSVSLIFCIFLHHDLIYLLWSLLFLFLYKISVNFFLFLRCCREFLRGLRRFLKFLPCFLL